MHPCAQQSVRCSSNMKGKSCGLVHTLPSSDSVSVFTLIVASSALLRITNSCAYGITSPVITALLFRICQFENALCCLGQSNKIIIVRNEFGCLLFPPGRTDRKLCCLNTSNTSEFIWITVKLQPSQPLNPSEGLFPFFLFLFAMYGSDRTPF